MGRAMALPQPRFTQTTFPTLTTLATRRTSHPIGELDGVATGHVDGRKRRAIQQGASSGGREYTMFCDGLGGGEGNGRQTLKHIGRSSSTVRTGNPGATPSRTKDCVTNSFRPSASPGIMKLEEIQGTGGRLQEALYQVVDERSRYYPAGQNAQIFHLPISPDYLGTHLALNSQMALLQSVLWIFCLDTQD